MAQVVVASGFGGPEVLSVVEQPVPPPGQGEVSLRVLAAGVNPLDCLEYSGAFGADPDALPLRLGHELAGVVTAVGAGASGPDGVLEVGDEVVAYHRGGTGAYATEVTWPAAVVVPKPAALGWAPAAGLPLAGATAVHALTAVSVGAGDTVLVHGVSGSVGTLAAQLARRRGARVVGTAAPSRHERLRAMGVEPVAYGPGLVDRVRDRVATRSVDAAVDAAGTDEAIDASLALVADRGRIATIVSFRRGNELGIRTLGAGGGATDAGTEIRRRAWPDLVALAAGGELTVPVAETFALADAAAAHRLVLTGHTGGKVVLLP